MPSQSKRNDDVIETHYYEETNTNKKPRVREIFDRKKQKDIDACLAKNNNVPPENTTRERGYSSIKIHCDMKHSKPKINPSLVRMRKVTSDDGTTYIISRLANGMAPDLPHSCLAATEHLLAMQDKVTDFRSEHEPASKKHVMYQILVKCTAKTYDIDDEITTINELVRKDDTKLKASDVTVTYDKDQKCFVVEVGTQVADIKQIVCNFDTSKNYKIINADFDKIDQDGIVAVNKFGENPIHAVANIFSADTSKGPIKGYLERDAGKTSGETPSSNKLWLFNIFNDANDFLRRNGYNKNARLIKVYRKVPNSKI